MASKTREAMIRSAAELIRTRGLPTTSFTDVLARSGTSRGVIYHHFPDGKAQLAREAVAWTEQDVLARLREGSHRTPAEVVDAFVDMLREVITSTGGPGCTVGAVAQDSATDPSLLRAAAGAFRTWSAELAGQLCATGISTDQARAFATLMVATLEGAHLLCRAEGSPAPLDEIAAGLRRSVASLPQ